MGTPEPAAQGHAGGHDHGYHPLEVRRVVTETDDARSFVLGIPTDLRDAFAYDAGQFCTFRVWIDGVPHIRCYSMSSSPATDLDMQVTVKRVPGGAVSNWMIDSLSAGDVVESTAPAGFFRLGPGGGDLVLFAAGSGITPIFSLTKTALATTERRVRLLYANRDRDGVIFGRELSELEERFASRLAVTHHLDVEHGYVAAGDVEPYVDAAVADGEFYVCGPAPFMDVVESTLLARGVDPVRIHIERFTATPVPAAPVDVVEDGDAGSTIVTIELDGRTAEAEHRAGTTILQTARQVGLSPPYSCEGGNCATCMARIVEGAATMYVNNALDPDEVEDGWVLTCQAVPTTPSVRVVYGYGD